MTCRVWPCIAAEEVDIFYESGCAASVVSDYPSQDIFQLRLLVFPTDPY